MQYAKSPEATGTYTCLVCGNREHFTGVDHHGTAGDVDDCDVCHPGDGMYCDCPTTLTQGFRVNSDASDEERQRIVDGRAIANEYVDYDSHEGGGSGAEIGSYDEVWCGRCGALLWESVTPAQELVS